MGPLAQQRRLAKPGRRGDEGQIAVQARVQSFDQARARDQGGARRRDIEFGGQEWNVLSAVEGWRGHNAIILPRLPHTSK